MSDDADASAEELTSEEARYIPFARSDNFGVNNGVQVASADSVHFHASWAAETTVIMRRAGAAELEDVRRHFVAPGRFDDAVAILAKDRIVVLSGQGTGRSHAARRLLVGVSIAVAELKRDRPLDALVESDLSAGEGYLWDCGGPGGLSVEGWEFDHAQHIVRAAGGYLVIIVDDPRQMPAHARRQVVGLGVPDPVEVAVDHLRTGQTDDAMQAFKGCLVDRLRPGDPPRKAAFAADLARRVAHEGLAVGAAQAELDMDTGGAVAEVMTTWSVFDHCLSFTVAILENEPYELVVKEALKLESLIMAADRGELGVRRTGFDRTKSAMLATVRAGTVVRDHSRFPGLTEETVSFTRPDWASAALLHTWREYHLAADALLKWMCDRELLSTFPGATARALCLLITALPAHDPLAPVRSLSGKSDQLQRDTARDVLMRLADDYELEPVVRQTLDEWIASARSYRPAIAAWVYGSRFAGHDLDHALAGLGKLASNGYRRVQAAVVRAVLTLLSRAEYRDAVVAAVVQWCRAGHPAGLSVAMWVLGFSSDPAVDTPDPARLSVEYPAESAELLAAVLADPDLGVVAVRWMARKARVGSPDLVRVATLVAPDLSWWARRTQVAWLASCFPDEDVRRTFRQARRLERQ
ncbi:MAG TPA: hypothetical protein VM677_22515 [Actinokineospora sp.]|jgi:hypothetical protein|nr:hypothetical protein [Actinokineospora sp.]